MKVKITTRSVYHKIARVDIEVPNHIKEDMLRDWIDTNEHLYVDKIDKAMSVAEYDYGFGLEDGMVEKGSESEWRFDIVGKQYGGHL